MNHSATRIPSSGIIGFYPWPTGGSIGKVLPQYRGAVNIFYNPNWQPSGSRVNTDTIIKTGGARGVMVIVAGSGHGDMSSNPGWDWLHFT